ncbi:type III-B CRISPR module RAMP protein Cmr1 [Methanocaldococcus fervens]|uniref:CRISPR type III-associated protein domain-containing protein n=1 Tax=Methanocaldococcus fervens (strain DSM 4213 / JCM 15782 / AG86) TaxID=573064 RepID=C7P6D1_METFA|nr:type III-B CRISPR module RAMP protein Cmr1 [Methanocaldococcus fervens]ACV24113.1 protein of unknown function DUF324 [Methanocaldococcus fervens AG86]
MDKVELKVKFETLTPLWNGNAWGQCMEIRPSSILGSLRFWFEVLCYFNGIIDNEYFDENGKPSETLDYKKFKELKDKIKSKMDLEKAIDKILKDMEISLPSRIFGCTGWRGRIRIKKIESIEDYCFGNKLNIPYAIGIKKDNDDDKNIIEWRTKNDYYQFIKEKYHGDNNNFKKDWSVWYFPHPYFYGKFEVIFETDEVIKDDILIPLLNFIDEYGCLGGKWNIGYGRVKVRGIEIKNENNWKEVKDWEKKKVFDFSNFALGKKDETNTIKTLQYIELIEEVNNFDKLLNKEDKIFVLKNNINENNFKDIIKELIKIKAQKRKEHKENDGNENERHQLFGHNNPTEGSKILPYIYEDKDNGKLKGGFISIAGILNIKGGKNARESN